MKIYMAARYSRHKELQGYAKQLIADGHEITSRWIWGTHQLDDAGLSVEAKRSERERFAKEDIEDLLKSEICISFTEEPRATNSRGGRHVEYGIAIGAKQRCIIVGPQENVFHCLPQVLVCESFELAILAIRLLVE